MPSRCRPVHRDTEVTENTEPLRCACSRVAASQSGARGLPPRISATSAADQNSPLALASRSPPSHDSSASASHSSAGAPPVARTKASAAVSIRAPMPVPSARAIRRCASAVVAEEHRDQLHALDRHPRIRRRVGRGPAREGAALRRVAGEQQRLGERERRGRALVAVGQRVVGEPQVLDRQRRVHLGGGDAELEVQPAAQLGRRRLLQGALQVGHRAVGTAALRGLAGGGAQELDGGAVAAARGVQDLGGDLLGRRVRARQHVGGAAVPELALAGRDVEVDDVADQRMREAQRRLGAQDVRSRELAGGARDGLLVEPGERGDGRQARALAQHGDSARHGHRVGRQPRQAQQDGPRHGARADLAHGGRAARAGRHAVLLERREQVTQQQRVAARRLPAGGGEARIGQAEPLASPAR